MALKCGIVGLPNVGKSTLFQAITKAQVDCANYPFCTIEPNIGVVNVPDPRLSKLEELVNPERVQPATVEIVDIAGLVKGASKGEGSEGEDGVFGQEPRHRQTHWRGRTIPMRQRGARG